MSNLYTVKLKCPFGAKFHLGKIAIDQNVGLDDTSEWIHSDTLFSAIVNIAASISTKKAEEIIQLFESEEILISSAFYYIKPKKENSKTIYFLPTPVNCSNKVCDNYKQIKKVKFMSSKIWENGIEPDKWGNDNYPIINNKFVCTSEELKEIKDYKQLKIYSKISEPKVMVRKEENTGGVYNQTNIQLECNPFFFDKLDCGFYFIIQSKNDIPSILKLVLDLLPDTGIGGERSSGCGLFDGIEKEEINKEHPLSKISDNSNKGYMNISLLIPSNQEGFNHIDYYQLITRGGRKTNSGVTLNRVKMISEGAVCYSNKIQSSIKNIAPENTTVNALRYGKALYVSINELYLPRKDKS